MEKQLDYLEAWTDFYRWILHPARWKNVDRAGRDRIAKAQQRYILGKPARLNYEGVKSLLEQYAHGRYEFKENIILYED